MSESEHVQPSPTPQTPAAHDEHIQAAPSPHGAEHGHEAAPSPFSDAELEVFHKEDRMGGGLVVGLMAGIFTIGLLLYITVAIMVVRGA
jgi:hypothetical protein